MLQSMGSRGWTRLGDCTVMMTMLKEVMQMTSKGTLREPRFEKSIKTREEHGIV